MTATPILNGFKTAPSGVTTLRALNFFENGMDRITRMEQNLYRLQTPPGVTDRIVDLCLDLLRKQRRR